MAENATSQDVSTRVTDLKNAFKTARSRTEEICNGLKTEDFVVQPVVDVSPPKWHLGHTTWFFEEFILSQIKGYKKWNESYSFVFNSYYETVGKRVMRTDRGNLSRPTVEEVYSYRHHVTDAITRYFEAHLIGEELLDVIEIGINHEQQHQELLVTDIKYILGHNPLLPSLGGVVSDPPVLGNINWVKMNEGVYEIGHTGSGFCFDNELGRHKVYLQDFEISDTLVTNREFVEFIEAKGYESFEYWHAEGWDWVKGLEQRLPMYWHKVDGKYMYYTLDGLKEIDWDQPIKHISFYEASAFAEWKGMRLPTEFEWEAAHSKLKHGQRWEWTNSAYLPYPGFSKMDGALGEYNGKFMINQMVLRGGSVATPLGHSRPTYRNFFHANLRWQYTGIRLVK